MEGELWLVPTQFVYLPSKTEMNVRQSQEIRGNWLWVEMIAIREKRVNI